MSNTNKCPFLACFVKVCERSSSPLWDETFYFLIRDPNEEMLQVKVSYEIAACVCGGLLLNSGFVFITPTPSSNASFSLTWTVRLHTCVVLRKQIKLSTILRQIEFVSQFHVPLKMHIRSFGILIEMTFPELLDVGCSVILTILMPSLPNVMPFISAGNCISIKHITQCCCPGHCFPFQISIMEQVNTVHLHIGTIVCKRKVLYLTQTTFAIEIWKIKSTF